MVCLIEAALLLLEPIQNKTYFLYCQPPQWIATFLTADATAHTRLVVRVKFAHQSNNRADKRKRRRSKREISHSTLDRAQGVPKHSVATVRIQSEIKTNFNR